MEKNFEKKKEKKNKEKKGKHEMHVGALKFKHVRPNRLCELLGVVRSQMEQAVKLIPINGKVKMTPEVLVLTFVNMKDTHPEVHAMFLRTLKSLARDIYGTWMPIIKMKSADNTNGGTPAVTNVGATFVNTYAISTSTLANISALWGIFDEYKVVGPFTVMFIPSDNATTRLWALGAIDYSNVSDLSSVAEAMSYDTVQLFDIMPYHMTSKENTLTRWYGHVLGQPDKIWVTTGTNITVGYLKTYSFNAADSSWGISTTYGYFTHHMEIQFRQLNQGG